MKKDQICADEKTLCGSFNRSKSIQALPRVKAWSTSASMNLAQVPTEEKSNEITSIPERLDLLHLRGCWVSIEEIGCQTAIAQKLIEKSEKGLDKATEELFKISSTQEKNRLPPSEHIEKKRECPRSR